MAATGGQIDRHQAPRPAEAEARAPVHDQVYGAIKSGLVDGRFVPGRSVTLRGLAAMLGVSPMPVRAAVTRLVAEGALALTPTRRVCVPAMTAERFDELVRARILLEGEAAMRSLPFIDSAMLRRVRGHDARLEACLAVEDAGGYMATIVDQHERAIDAIERGDGRALRAAIEADISEGMNIIGRSAL